MSQSPFEGVDDGAENTSALNKPVIELLPNKANLKSDGRTELYVLARITPPQTETKTKRPVLNLGLVIDRSGSMQGSSLQAAKAAARYAVSQLTEQDRVSVTIFDNEIETIVPSTLATDKRSIRQRIGMVECGGSTALHGGWVEGGLQVSRHLDEKALNRVLLLTDGLANVGETNPDRICTHVHGLMQHGVSTSTLGVGDDFNEDLLQAMADSGDGHYYHIETAADIEQSFTDELHGIMATQGRMVSLGIEPQGGVEVLDVLNDLERNDLGRLMLSNLIVGRPIEVVIKLLVPAPKKSKAEETDVCFVRLAWTAPGDLQRHITREVLSLSAVPTEQWDDLPEDQRVMEQVAHKEAARIRQKAIEEMQRGDLDAARSHLQSHRDYVSAAAPQADWLQQELDESQSVEDKLGSGERAGAMKAAKFANYRTRRSR